MARIRTVKPELFRHESLYEAERASGLPLRLAYIGLFTVADCEGRFRWRSRSMKLDVLPYDDVDFEDVLTTLEKHGFIHSYEVEGERYGAIPTLKKHQVFQTKEIQTGSRWPVPPEHTWHVPAHVAQQHMPVKPPVTPPVPDEFVPVIRDVVPEVPEFVPNYPEIPDSSPVTGSEQIAANSPVTIVGYVTDIATNNSGDDIGTVLGRERDGTGTGTELQEKERKKGKEERKWKRVSAACVTAHPRKRKVGLPSDFAVSDAVREWACKNHYGDLEQHLESFKDKATARGYQYADWDAAFRNAIRDDWAGLRKMAAFPGGGRRQSNAPSAFTDPMANEFGDLMAVASRPVIEGVAIHG